MIESEYPPFRNTGKGALRVGQTRVLLEIVIHAYQDGSTPEQIVEAYDTLKLADVYATIAYYLRHKVIVDAYLDSREQKAEEVKQRIEKHQGDLTEIRKRVHEYRESEKRARSDYASSRSRYRPLY